MTSIEKSIEITKNLGFEGKSATEFAISQQAIEHNEPMAQRLSNREAEKEKVEVEERRIQAKKCPILPEKETAKEKVEAKERRILAKKEAAKEKAEVEECQILAKKDKAEAEEHQLLAEKQNTEAAKQLAQERNDN